MQKIIFRSSLCKRQEVDQQINRCESIDGSTHRLSRRDCSILPGQWCRQSTTSTINSSFLSIVAVRGKDKTDDLIHPQELHRVRTIVAVDQSTRLFALFHPFRFIRPVSSYVVYHHVYLHIRVYAMCIMIESERERNEGNGRPAR